MTEEEINRLLEILQYLHWKQNLKQLGDHLISQGGYAVTQRFTLTQEQHALLNQYVDYLLKDKPHTPTPIDKDWQLKIEGTMSYTWLYHGNRTEAIHSLDGHIIHIDNGTIRVEGNGYVSRIIDEQYIPKGATEWIRP